MIDRTRRARNLLKTAREATTQDVLRACGINRLTGTVTGPTAIEVLRDNILPGCWDLAIAVARTAPREIATRTALVHEQAHGFNGYAVRMGKALSDADSAAYRGTISILTLMPAAMDFIAAAMFPGLKSVNVAIDLPADDFDRLWALFWCAVQNYRHAQYVLALDAAALGAPGVTVSHESLSFHAESVTTFDPIAHNDMAVGRTLNRELSGADQAAANFLNAIGSTTDLSKPATCPEGFSEQYDALNSAFADDNEFPLTLALATLHQFDPGLLSETANAEGLFRTDPFLDVDEVEDIVKILVTSERAHSESGNAKKLRWTEEGVRRAIDYFTLRPLIALASLEGDNSGSSAAPGSATLPLMGFADCMFSSVQTTYARNVWVHRTLSSEYFWAAPRGQLRKACNEARGVRTNTDWEDHVGACLRATGLKTYRNLEPHQLVEEGVDGAKGEVDFVVKHRNSKTLWVLDAKDNLGVSTAQGLSRQVSRECFGAHKLEQKAEAIRSSLKVASKARPVFGIRDGSEWEVKTALVERERILNSFAGHQTQKVLLSELVSLITHRGPTRH